MVKSWLKSNLNLMMMTGKRLTTRQKHWNSTSPITGRGEMAMAKGDGFMAVPGFAGCYERRRADGTVYNVSREQHFYGGKKRGSAWWTASVLDGSMGYQVRRITHNKYGIPHHEFETKAAAINACIADEIAALNIDHRQNTANGRRG